MIEFFIAKKHILERKRQSLISIIGVMIGITVLIVSIGISNGLDKNMIKSVLSISSHILVQPGSAFGNYESLKKEIEEIKGVKGVIANIPAQGILKYKGPFKEYISGIKIQGFDLATAADAMDLNEKIVVGKIDDAPNSILIGSEMAGISGAGVGDELTLVSADGKEINFTVSGIFKTGYYDYDANVVMINLVAAQYMNYLDNKIKEFNIMLNNPYDADKISAEIFKKFGIMGRTWGEMNRNLLSALALEKTVMIIVFSLIVVIAGFVVWVTLNMLVREKIKDIGIMRAMGFSKKNIGKIFLFQGFILGGIGMILGVGIALFILWYIKNYSLPGISSIYYIQKVPIEISMREILIILGANLLIIFISSIFPAYRGASLETQEALKYE